MAQQKVELRKIRDFSDNLNDTFLFIRQNLKPLLTSFLGIAGIFMLAAAIFSGVYQGDMSGMLTRILQGNAASANNPYQFINANYFLVILFSWINIVAMQVVIVSYMKAYENNKGATPTIDDVWKIFRADFLLIFIYTLLTTILMAIGLLFCLLPGIFLLVAFTPLPAIIIIEGKDFSEAFSRCFALLKNNFWISFGLYLLVYIIYSFSGGIISAIIGALAGLLYYFTTKNISSTVGIVTSVLSIFSFVFYIVYYVSVVLHYYNLSERLDGTGILQRLDTLGGSSPTFGNIQEEY